MFIKMKRFSGRMLSQRSFYLSDDSLFCICAIDCMATIIELAMTKCLARQARRKPVVYVMLTSESNRQEEFLLVCLPDCHSVMEIGEIQRTSSRTRCRRIEKYLPHVFYIQISFRIARTSVYKHQKEDEEERKATTTRY